MSFNPAQTFYLGIDPGKKGGIVVISGSNAIVFKSVMPIIHQKLERDQYDDTVMASVMKQILEQVGPISYAMLERTQVFPLNGKISSHQMGLCEGLWRGILRANNVPFETVRPQTWQGEILRGVMREDTKQASILHCETRWPKENWKVGKKAIKAHDGLTDAACLALYAKLKGR